MSEATISNKPRYMRYDVCFIQKTNVSSRKHLKTRNDRPKYNPCHRIKTPAILLQEEDCGSLFYGRDCTVLPAPKPNFQIPIPIQNPNPKSKSDA